MSILTTGQMASNLHSTSPQEQKAEKKAKEEERVENNKREREQTTTHQFHHSPSLARLLTASFSPLLFLLTQWQVDVLVKEWSRAETLSVCKH